MLTMYKKICIVFFLIALLLTAGCAREQESVPEQTAPAAALTAAPTEAPSPAPTEELSAVIAGRTYTLSDTAVTLSEADPAVLDELSSALSVLSSIRTVDLSAAVPSNKDMLPLISAFPDVLFIWDPELCGERYSGMTEELDLSGKRIASAEDIRSALPCFPNLKKLIVSDCGLSDEELDGLNREFPDTEIVWTVYFCGGRRSLRTDAVAYSTKNSAKKNQTSREAKLRMTDKDTVALSYCRNLVALDLGHNEFADLSFLKELSRLQILILADNRITDITPLENLHDLVYLEAFMNRITDLTPLSGLTNLLDLNLCHNTIKDASPLFQCKSLQRLWISSNKIPKADRPAIEAALPAATIEFQEFDSTGKGWRKHERYFWMHSYFYPDQFGGVTPDPASPAPGAGTPSPEQTPTP